MKKIAEPTTSATAQPAGEATPSKAARAPRGAHVAPAKGKAGKKATPAKGTPKSAKRAKAAKAGTGSRGGSKSATILELLKRPGGASSAELQKATSWQPHSVRGFLSGTVGKKMGLTVVSAKMEDGGRKYTIEA